jgi:hypothetical protein
MTHNKFKLYLVLAVKSRIRDGGVYIRPTSLDPALRFLTRESIGTIFHRMLRIDQKDRMPITTSSKLTICPWPTLQRANVNLMLMSTCTRKKKTRNKSSLVCISMACCRGSNVLFHQAYPEIRKMIMKIRSIQAQIRLIFTRSRPRFKENSPDSLFNYVVINLLDCERTDFADLGSSRVSTRIRNISKSPSFRTR